MKGGVFNFGGFDHGVGELDASSRDGREAVGGTSERGGLGRAEAKADSTQHRFNFIKITEHVICGLGWSEHGKIELRIAPTTRPDHPQGKSLTVPPSPVEPSNESTALVPGPARFKASSSSK